MGTFLELQDSYELYEFSRQYYLDIDMKQAKTLKFPISVYFDENGHPSFKSTNTPPKKYKLNFMNGTEKFGFESDDIEEVVAFVRQKSGRRPHSNDIVGIVNVHKVLAYNTDFFRDNFIDYDYACRFDYGMMPDVNAIYRIVVVCGNLLLVQNTENEKCYIVEEDNIEFMTEG